jgi:hypothetical protein
MRSPLVAMLWELWRVTRTEAAWKLAIAIVGSVCALILFTVLLPEKKEAGVVISMIFLVLPHTFTGVSLGFLSAGRPGFPLRLLYTRPVRTSVIVGLPMAYLAAASAVTYLVSALVVRLTLDYPIPLLPVAAWIVAFNLIQLANNWSARRTAVMHLAGMVATTAWMIFATYRVVSFPASYSPDPKPWLAEFDLPLTDYLLIALIGLASFGIAVTRVERQRHAAPTELPWSPAAGLRGWLIQLFRVPCPTSSSTRAQVWYDLKSSGVPLLTIGVGLAILYPLLLAITGAIDAAIAELLPVIPCSRGLCLYTRVFVVLFAMVFPVLTLAMGANAFGIRRRPGGSYVSAFEATQPYDAARIASLKILVKSACVLAALLLVGLSVWNSLSSLPFLEQEKLFIELAGALNSQQRGIEGAVMALTGYEKLAFAVVAVIGVILWVATLAALGALWARYSRRANTAASLLLLLGLALALLALAGRNAIVPAFLIDALFTATRWIAAAALTIATIYFAWSGISDRVLTIRYACGAFLISAAFCAAWLSVVHAAGVQPAVSILWPVLLPPLASVLAPWSLNRIRHT